jgi:hypothetical protein
MQVGVFVSNARKPGVRSISGTKLRRLFVQDPTAVHLFKHRCAPGVDELKLAKLREPPAARSVVRTRCRNRQDVHQHRLFAQALMAQPRIVAGKLAVSLMAGLL